ncbi:tyrosine-type recombinase/integrase [Rahnella aceris]|uniref:tyrosine-type DNA invertase n=1 Tax=Rahnella sp. (strain Y9602) TaxID=2703885 RepID=UPI001C25D63F|nr:tyrosine-type DNA invertase [Rahnella aceris]MBU9839247.1 tyrosine-type recombinase/integrase [Rahnella aceris]
MTQRKYLTQFEVQAMLTAAQQGSNPERDYCLVYMSFIHGLRVGEARLLRLSDIDLYDGCLYIRRLKNGFSTNHPLLEDEIKCIREWKAVREGFEDKDSDWLFLSRQGGPLSRQRIYDLMSALGRKANLPVVSHPHMLRHACGFALADRGIDTRLIQDYLGHRNIRHTVRYTASNAGRFGGIWHPGNRSKVSHLGPNCKQL